MNEAVLRTRVWHPYRSWTPQWRLARRRFHGWSKPIRARQGAMAASVAAALVLVLVLAIAVVRLCDQAETAPTSMPSPLPEWVDLPRAEHVFVLDSPMLIGLPALYSAKSRTAWGGRVDTLAFGTPGHDSKSLQLRVERRPDSIAQRPPLVAVIASQAADAGLSVERAGLSDLMPTRFGGFEVAAVTLIDGAAARLPCQGFRLALDAPGLTISGVACGRFGEPVTRSELSCVMDRLELSPRSDDRELIAFFAATKSNRDPGCLEVVPEIGSLAVPLQNKPVTHANSSRRHSGNVAAISRP